MAQVSALKAELSSLHLLLQKEKAVLSKESEQIQKEMEDQEQDRHNIRNGLTAQVKEKKGDLAGVTAKISGL
jgi:hypothetical protein